MRAAKSDTATQLPALPSDDSAIRCTYRRHTMHTGNPTDTRYTRNGYPLTRAAASFQCDDCGRCIEEGEEFIEHGTPCADSFCIECAELLPYNSHTLKCQLLKRGLAAVAVGGCADLSLFGFMVDTQCAAPFTKDGQIVLADDECGAWVVLRYSYNEDEGTVWTELATDSDPWVALRRAGVTL